MLSRNLASGSYSDVNDALYKGTAPPGGVQKRHVNRQFILKANDIPNNEQAIALKVLFGTQKITGNYIYPVFDYRAQKVSQSVPKGDSIVVGYNYFGSLALALCVGPVTTLHEIRNSDKVIWTGPLESTSADENGMTLIVTSLGPVNFYWGTDTQLPDSLLEALELDTGSGIIPAIIAGLPRVCYAVCSRFRWGRQPAPPALEFVLSKYPSSLTLTSHNLTGDAVLPECLYEWLTDTFYGLGVPASKIDTASFVAACETLIAEDLGVSPFVDDFSDAREVLGKFNEYVEGFPYIKNGKIFYRLIRDGDETPIAIGDADIAEEPQPRNEGWDETWNFTRVSFKDRLNKWSDGTGVYDDPANGIITGEDRSKQYDLNWITRQSVADKIAAKLGIKGGKPAAFWNLSLLPQYRTLAPGKMLSVTHAKLGITARPMRVVEITQGSAEEPMVQVQCVEEVTRGNGDFVPDDAGPDVPVFVGDGGSDPTILVDATPRIAALPTTLKDGALDGFLVAVDRPTNTASYFALYYTYDVALQDFELIENKSGFPFSGVLLWWKKWNDNWLLRVQFPNDWDFDDFSTASGLSDFYFTVGHRVWRTDTTNEHQTITLWGRKVIGGRKVAITSSVFDIEVTDAEFGSIALALERAAVDGQYPTANIYFAPLADFAIEASDVIVFDRNMAGGVGDTALLRSIKTPVGSALASQDITDVDAVTYDRDLATMCPEGTFSRNWGHRSLTAYEYYDRVAALAVLEVTDARQAFIDDLDEALEALRTETSTATQDSLATDLDAILGAMVDVRSQANYNLPGL